MDSCVVFTSFITVNSFDCTEVLSLFFAAIPLTIGIRKTFYFVNENSGSVSICIGVLSGSITWTGYSLYFQTIDGDAIGKHS